jgi:hypothetical protein
MPVGPVTIQYVKDWAGMSVSDADNDNDKVVSSLNVWLATAASTGAAFASRTTTWNDPVTVVTPSLTDTVTTLVLGPCASVGVHANTPPEVTVIPLGPSTNAYVNACAGTSPSVALKVNVNGVSSSNV